MYPHQGGGEGGWIPRSRIPTPLYCLSAVEQFLAAIPFTIMSLLRHMRVLFHGPFLYLPRPVCPHYSPLIRPFPALIPSSLPNTALYPLLSFSIHLTDWGHQPPPIHPLTVGLLTLKLDRATLSCLRIDRRHGIS